MNQQLRASVCAHLLFRHPNGCVAHHFMVGHYMYLHVMSSASYIARSGPRERMSPQRTDDEAHAERRTDSMAGSAINAPESKTPVPRSGTTRPSSHTVAKPTPR